MIAKDLLKTLLSVWIVIVVIIVSKSFIRVLDKAIEGQVSNETLAWLLGLKTIVAGVAFLPASIFMAILMVLGRMYRDQEMAAFASAGGGAGAIYRATFILVVPLTLLTLVLSLYTAPWAEAKMEKLMEQDEQSADIRGISAGKFSEYSQGDLVFYAEEITPDQNMNKIFVQHKQKSKLAIINADSARFRDLPDGSYIVLKNGERIQGNAGEQNFIIEQFKEYAVRIDPQEADDSVGREGAAADNLWKSDNLGDIAELQRRFSIPLGLFLLSFLAVPLAQISPRGGVYGNILVGFLIYFTYGNLVRVSHSWVKNGVLPPWLGASSVNMLLIVIGLALLIRLYGWQWLLIKAREWAAK
ncbi:MAG: LPS export ABC transporter permease LptF [Gammaproteobacteria bacterium]